MNKISITSNESINELLKTLSPDKAYIIELAPGRYYEKIEILHSNLTFIGTGSSPADTILEYDDYAFAPMKDDSKRGTFRSYSVLIDASNITMKNLTIKNSSGDENQVGQAIALYADGDNLLFENIRLEGRQDTLFTGPLPPKELQPGGFIGPKQFSPRINGKHIYRNCYICGNVDFIFGSASALFENCEIESLSHIGSEIQGYVTAPSTPEGQEYGYLFNNCHFTSSCPAESVYLSRPWRDYAKSVFVNCTIGNHIHKDGFHDWGKENARSESFFSCINCKTDKNQTFKPEASFAKETNEKYVSDFYKFIES